MQVRFSALEYGIDGSFAEARYVFTGNETTGWEITRNGAHHLDLLPGHRLFAVERCGICATDLARRHLPFPLPQVIGHEVVARDALTGARVCLEINDTCAARGDAAPEIFCAAGLPTHCPGRMVLGIDRLPGGFGPWVLAPRHAAVDAADLTDDAAVLVEPFAAALHAVRTSPPLPGDRVAVLGTGRLGLLIVAALKAARGPVPYGITALSRHAKLRDAARALGADETADPADGRFDGAFDLVFEATGSPEGLDRALTLARREVHIKSTTGLPYHGFNGLTAMVVDECALLPWSLDGLERVPALDPTGEGRLLRPHTGEAIALPPSWTMRAETAAEAAAWLISSSDTGRLPRFDAGLAESLNDIDTLIRPFADREESLVRPRGVIFYSGDGAGHPLLRFIARGGCISTSRCGDFNEAISLLRGNPETTDALSLHLIAGTYPARELPRAFAMASDPGRLKIIIRH